MIIIGKATGEIVADKYATYEVLKSQNVPVIEYKMIFNPAIRPAYIPVNGNSEIIIDEFSKYGKLVVKPNDGSEGMDIELCNTLREVEVAIQKLFSKGHASVSICPYYDIKTEYRTFYLDGEILLIYGKTKPFVIGNGSSSLGELIKTLNLPENEVVKDNLRSLNLNYIPEENKKVEISWKHNLSGGAIPNILEKGELYQKIEKLALEAGKAIGINFATVDVIQTTDNKLYIMEINSNVYGEVFAKKVEGGYDIIKDIYKKAIESMFK